MHTPRLWGTDARSALSAPLARHGPACKVSAQALGTTSTSFPGHVLPNSLLWWLSVKPQAVSDINQGMSIFHEPAPMTRITANDLSKTLPVANVAERSRVVLSALHVYDTKSLIRSWRTGANQRLYHRGVLRKLPSSRKQAYHWGKQNERFSVITLCHLSLRLLSAFIFLARTWQHGAPFSLQGPWPHPRPARVSIINRNQEAV